MGDRPTVIAGPPKSGLLPVQVELPADGSGEPDPPGPPPPRPIRCDQAIFTSIRSPLGQGYRLVAASPGVTAAERVEIVQRAPSHGSLCDPSPDAVGLLSYRLGTGRLCVACCLHAGVEHTGRGGLRVYTHLAILEPADVAALKADVVAVHGALRGYLSKEGPVLKPPPRLQPLTLSVPVPAPPAPEPAEQADAQTPPVPDGAVAPGAPGPPAPEPAPWIAGAAADLHAGRTVIVIGADDPLPPLEALLARLTPDEREGISLSVGLRFAPSRRVRLVMLPADDPALAPLVAGRNITLHRCHPHASCHATAV